MKRRNFLRSFFIGAGALLLPTPKPKPKPKLAPVVGIGGSGGWVLADRMTNPSKGTFKPYPPNGDVDLSYRITWSTRGEQ